MLIKQGLLSFTVFKTLRILGILGSVGTVGNMSPHFVTRDISSLAKFGYFYKKWHLVNIEFW